MTPRTWKLLEVMTEAGLFKPGCDPVDTLRHLVELGGPMRANTGLTAESSLVAWRAFIFKRLSHTAVEHPVDRDMLRRAAVLCQAISEHEWAELMAGKVERSETTSAERSARAMKSWAERKAAR